MAKVIAASLTLDAEGAKKSVKEFKQELKDAQYDVIHLSEKFGATSKEAIAAAKRVAELKDAIGDSKALIDAFNPDKKFNGFASALGAVTGGFTAIQGAMGLLGVESEDLQKQLLKVQSAMAFSQGLNQFGDAIQSVKTFGQQLVANLGRNGLIGVAIAGVGLLVASLTGLLDGTKKINAAQKAYNDTTKDYKNAAADAIQKVTEVRTAFDLAKKGLISKDEALKQYNETLGDSLGHTKSLATAEKNLADKADVYIKVTALKAQANALFAISAQKSADALVLQNDVIDKIGKGGGRFVQDLKKQIEENKKSLEQGSKDIEKLGEGLIRQAAILAKTGKVSFTGDKPDKKTDPKEDPRIQAEKDALAEIQKLKQENFLATIANEQKRQEEQIKVEFGNEKARIDKLKISQELKDELLKQLTVKRDIALNELRKKALEEEQKLDEKAAEQRLALGDKIGAKTTERLAKEFEERKKHAEALLAVKTELDNAELTETELKLVQLDEWYKKRLEIVKGNEELTTRLIEEYEKKKTQIGTAEANARIQTAQFAANQLSAIADLIGKQTAAGKALAVASATINTYLAASKALAGDYSVYGPAAPYVRIATVISTIALGLKQVAAIVKTQVPGGGGGGSVPSTSTLSTASVSAPLQPRPQVTTTALDASTLGAIGNATVRAFIFESDVTNNRERITRLNRQARLGG